MNVERQQYDAIGVGYGTKRKADLRILQSILDALGGTRSILNVGAGTGSYEPPDRFVVAVEPSVIMIGQRYPNAAPVVRASATHLPFADRSFDSTLAVLTLHHWSDRRAGILELQRVAAERVVILTCDPQCFGFWLTDDYFPDILDIDRPIFPRMDEFRNLLGDISTVPVLIPKDCTDGFLGAYWARPEAYLDPEVRAAISSFTKLSDVQTRIAQLEHDLQTGAWDERYAHLRELQELDLGYRIVISVSNHLFQQ
jgi:SAM-dependent methyltransferase